MKNVTMVCVDNTGVAYNADDSTTRMETFLTAGREYVGTVADGQFTTVADDGYTGVFSAERFEYA